MAGLSDFAVGSPYCTRSSNDPGTSSAQNASIAAAFNADIHPWMSRCR